MSDNWGTPDWILNLIFDRREFYDPCPLNPDGLRPFDGLTSKWPMSKPVFINPPFSNPGPWVDKAAAHEGEIVLLLPVDPTVGWWIRNSDSFRVTLLGVRIQFKGHAKSMRYPICIWRKP